MWVYTCVNVDAFRVGKPSHIWGQLNISRRFSYMFGCNKSNNISVKKFPLNLKPYNIQRETRTDIIFFRSHTFCYNAFDPNIKGFKLIQTPSKSVQVQHSNMCYPFTDLHRQQYICYVYL